MKKEKRKRYKNDNDHKKRDFDHINNEKKMWSCFKNKAGYLGIDHIVLNVNIKSIDRTLLNKSLQKNDLVIPKHSEEHSESYNVYEWYRFIKIQIWNFGELTISSESTKKYEKYCHLNLYHGGANFETVDLEGIKKRYKRASSYLKEMGIYLDDNPLFYILELAFTFATDLLLPLPARNLIVAALSAGAMIQNKKANGKVSNELDMPITENNRYKSNKLVFYDKITKAEGLNIIKCVWRDKRIYRIELSLSKDNLTKSSILKTCELNKLTDEMLRAYFISRIDQAITYYINKLCPASIDFSTDLLIESFSSGKQFYLSSFEQQLNCMYTSSTASFVIDLESLLHCNIKKAPISQKNYARTKNGFLKSPFLAKSSLTRMYGWEVERLFVFIKSCLGDVQADHLSHIRNGVHCYIVAYGEYKNRNTYLHEHIHSHISYDYRTIVSERIEKQWCNPSFALNTINEDVIYPDKIKTLKYMKMLHKSHKPLPKKDS